VGAEAGVPLAPVVAVLAENDARRFRKWKLVTSALQGPIIVPLVHDVAALYDTWGRPIAMPVSSSPLRKEVLVEWLHSIVLKV
jgi:hypothetical protein